MMNILYKIAELLLWPLPKKWNNKDTQGAVIAVVALSLLIAGVWSLSGCAGFTVSAELEHHSSVPQTKDLNTADQIGLCVEVPLAKHKYATLTEICLHKELDSSKPVFGDDPVGTIRIKQPIYKKSYGAT